MKRNSSWILIVIAIFIFIYYQGQYGKDASNVIETSGVDLAAVLDTSVTFSGQNMFDLGTTLPTEWVRVIKENGEGIKDLGAYRLSNTEVDTDPNDKYTFYYYYNTTGPSSTYYPQVEEYYAPMKESTDNKVGYGCEMDNKTKIIVRDSAGNIQSSTSNAQSIGATDNVDISLKIKVGSDKCFGIANAPKSNALCFMYNSNAFDKVSTNTGYLSVPPSVAGLTEAIGNRISCYKFPVIQDGGSYEISVKLDAGATEPQDEHNITVVIDDIMVYVNSETLEEEWGFVDEDNVELGVPLGNNLDKIYIS